MTDIGEHSSAAPARRASELGLRVASSLVLALVALVHLFRLFAGWSVVVTGFAVPLWWSAPIVVIFAGLALLVWREARG